MVVYTNALGKTIFFVPEGFNMKARNTIILLAALAALVSCSQGIASIPYEPDEPPQNETQIPQSPSAAETSTPTAAPTPDLPQKIGASLPASTMAFNNENIDTVQEIGVAQNGYRITRMTSDLKNAYIADRSGITLCEMSVEKPLIPSGADAFSEENTSIIVPCKNIINHWDILLRLDEYQTFNPADFVITPTGSHFLVVTDNDIQIYDREGDLIGALAITETDFKVELAVDGKYTALTYSDKVHIIDIQDGQTALRMMVPTRNFLQMESFWWFKNAWLFTSIRPRIGLLFMSFHRIPVRVGQFPEMDNGLPIMSATML